MSDNKPLDDTNKMDDTDTTPLLDTVGGEKKLKRQIVADKLLSPVVRVLKKGFRNEFENAERRADCRLRGWEYSQGGSTRNSEGNWTPYAATNRPDCERILNIVNNDDLSNFDTVPPAIKHHLQISNFRYFKTPLQAISTSTPTYLRPFVKSRQCVRRHQHIHLKGQFPSFLTSRLLDFSTFFTHEIGSSEIHSFTLLSDYWEPSSLPLLCETV